MVQCEKKLAPGDRESTLNKVDLGLFPKIKVARIELEKLP